MWHNRRTLEWNAERQRVESEVYEDALIWITNNTTAKDRAVLLTDSLILVTRLECGFVGEPRVKIKCKIKADYHMTHTSQAMQELGTTRL